MTVTLEVLSITVRISFRVTHAFPTHVAQHWGNQPYPKLILTEMLLLGM